MNNYNKIICMSFDGPERASCVVGLPTGGLIVPERQPFGFQILIASLHSQIFVEAQLGLAAERLNLKERCRPRFVLINPIDLAPHGLGAYKAVIAYINIRIGPPWFASSILRVLCDLI